MGPELSQIERAIIKKYRKVLWSPFVRAIREYELIRPGDTIAVAISGGKDSLLLAKLMQELYRNGERNFTLEFLAMDPGYTKEHRNNLEHNLQVLGIPCHIYDADIFAVSDHIAGEYPCYMCARMRRGFLYAHAQKLGCNKLALGHHFDDVIETILLNVLYAGKYNTMMPKLRAKNFENMELIRPLSYVREADILKFTNYAEIYPLDCACTVTAKRKGNQRYMIKALLARLKEDIPNVEMSIYRSAQNISLDQIIGYTTKGERYSFLDHYEDTQ